MQSWQTRVWKQALMTSFKGTEGVLEDRSCSAIRGVTTSNNPSTARQISRLQYATSEVVAVDVDDAATDGIV